MDQPTTERPLAGGLDPAERRRLAGRARTLHERLERPAATDTGAPDGADEILADWIDRLDGEDRFRARLESLGLTEAECREALADDAWPDEEPVPAWVDRVDDLLQFLAEAELPGGLPDDEVPFAEVVEAVVTYARHRMTAVDADAHLGEAAVADEVGLLRSRIATLCAQPLFVEFKTFVAERDRELALADDPPAPDQPRRYYEAFVGDLLAGGLRSFLLEYAFLARLLATVIDQWVEALAEFGARLAADRDALARAFNGGDPLGAVAAIREGGDRHAGGRATRIVSFEAGVRAVYKPRSVAVSQAFFDVVDWVDERSEGPDLRTAEYVVREDYGWMEWIEPRPCDSEVEVERFYQRIGRLIAVLYALRFYDGHLENLVAAGEHPVLVDLETVAAPEPPSLDGAGLRAYRRGTVLETDLLPTVDTTTGPGDSAMQDAVPDMGGLGEDEVTWGGLQLPEFTHVNTDRMELSFATEATSTEDNLPELDGEVAEPGDHWREIVEGFESCYATLLAEREGLLAEGGPIDGLGSARVRYLALPTYWYARLLGSLRVPRYLRTGVEFGCRTELLARRLVDDVGGTPAVHEAERRALVRLDVPRFTARVDDTALFHDGRVVEPEFFDDPARDLVVDRIEGLSEDDLDRQLTYLHMAFRGQVDYDHSETVVHDAPPIGNLEPVERARRLFERALEASVTATDGERAWVVQQGTTEGFTADRLGESLYDGRLGLGLFAAMLHRVDGGQRYRRVATEVVDPVVAAARAGADPDEPLGITGVGGTIYGLVRIADLLGEEQYREAAAALAATLPRERLASDDWLDVYQGGAGAILGLLALHEATGDGAALDRARLAGDRLLEASEDHDGVPVWWTTDEGVLRQGLSHGVSGIAFALARLGAVTGRSAYLDTATESLAFERDLYDPEEHNWRDRRFDGECTRTYCHGRPGIGLARLGLRSAGAGGAVREDLERALASPEPDRIDAVDHLCCGNFGRVDWLVEASDRLGENRYHEAARRLSAAALRRADDHGGFRGPRMNRHLYDPAFLTGEAGIGYALLRLEDPSLPCVLAFE